MRSRRWVVGSALSTAVGPGSSAEPAARLGTSKPRKARTNVVKDVLDGRAKRVQGARTYVKAVSDGRLAPFHGRFKPCSRVEFRAVCGAAQASLGFNIPVGNRCLVRSVGSIFATISRPAQLLRSRYPKAHDLVQLS